MNKILSYVLLFFLYSAIGWLIESLYCSIGQKRFINRGFLTGPMCPIYGTGALVMTLFLYNPFRDKPIMVFLLGMLLCDILEYAVSFLMELLFHARWWDYTYEFLNIKGRICLKHTVYWGLASVAFVYLVQPRMDSFITGLNPTVMNYILIGIFIVFALDVIHAFRKALDIRNLIIKLNSMLDTVSSAFSTVKNSIEGTYNTVADNFNKGNEKISEVQNELIAQVEDLFHQFELRFSFANKNDKNSMKYSSRFMHNNFKIEKYVKTQLGIAEYD